MSSRVDKSNLVEYILSDEYIDLLERAVAARYATSTNNKEKHSKAFDLIKKFRSKGRW